MEPDLQPVAREASADPVSSSGKPDFDLSSPESLEINFEDADDASERNKSGPEK